MSRLLLLGHRGARAIKSIPENTLASFDRALADGCDGFEFDVRLTADGEAVVCHDPKFESLEIARTPAKQLPSLPRLQDVLSRYSSAFLDIELKVAGLERIVAEAVKGFESKKLVVSAFLPEVVSALHVIDAGPRLGLICETKRQLRRWKEMPVEYVLPQHAMVNQDLIVELRGSHKKIVVWTVNAADDMRRLAGWGVDGIISDNPERLCATLAASRE